jgi:hypothetical protein
VTNRKAKVTSSIKKVFSRLILKSAQRQHSRLLAQILSFLEIPPAKPTHYGNRIGTLPFISVSWMSSTRLKIKISNLAQKKIVTILFALRLTERRLRTQGVVYEHSRRRSYERKAAHQG